VRGGCPNWTLHPPAFSVCLEEVHFSRPFSPSTRKKGGLGLGGDGVTTYRKTGFRRPAFHSFAERIVLSVGGSTDRPPPIL